MKIYMFYLIFSTLMYGSIITNYNLRIYTNNNLITIIGSPKISYKTDVKDFVQIKNIGGKVLSNIINYNHNTKLLKYSYSTNDTNGKILYEYRKYSYLPMKYDLLDYETYFYRKNFSVISNVKHYKYGVLFHRDDVIKIYSYSESNTILSNISIYKHNIINKIIFNCDYEVINISLSYNIHKKYRDNNLIYCKTNMIMNKESGQQAGGADK